MSKSYRQGQILKLVRAKQIYTQDELATELKAEGIAATQVTLSRDLRDLQLVKTGSGYQELGKAEPDDDETPPLGGLISDFLRDARQAQNQVVLKTDPGHASMIAVALDNEDWPEIVGTIAGDDTVLIIATDNDKAHKLRQRLLDFLE